MGEYDILMEKLNDAVEGLAKSVGSITTAIATNATRVELMERLHTNLETRTERDSRETDQKIDAFAREIHQFSKDIMAHFDKTGEKWQTDHDKWVTEQVKIDEKLSIRISAIERWRWTVLGSLAAILAIFEVVHTITSSNWIMSWVK
jgi:hypothetical protein